MRGFGQLCLGPLPIKADWDRIIIHVACLARFTIEIGQMTLLSYKTWIAGSIFYGFILLIFVLIFDKILPVVFLRF